MPLLRPLRQRLRKVGGSFIFCFDLEGPLVFITILHLQYKISFLASFFPSEGDEGITFKVTIDASNNFKY